MLNKLVHLSIKHRFFVVLTVCLMAVAGLYSAFTLPVDAVPDITTTQVVVNTSAPALSPEEVEVQITRRLELVLAGIPHVTCLRLRSAFGGRNGPQSQSRRHSANCTNLHSQFARFLANVLVNSGFTE